VPWQTLTFECWTTTASPNHGARTPQGRGRKIVALSTSLIAQLLIRTTCNWAEREIEFHADVVSGIEHAFCAGLALSFIAELKQRFEEQLDEGSGVTCEVTPYRLTIRYRDATVRSWQATREGARWRGPHDESDDRLVMREVYDALEVTKRALFLFIREVENVDGFTPN
jgi:hypothetical protein